MVVVMMMMVMMIIILVIIIMKVKFILLSSHEGPEGDSRGIDLLFL